MTLFIFFFILGLLSAQACFKGRLTQYPIHSINSIPQGTCGFGPVFSEMPLEFREGRIIAADQDYYNSFKTALDFTSTCNPKIGISCGLNCGQCVLITGAKGSATFMVADIGDYPTVGIQDAGDMPNFAISNLVNESLLKVADAPGMELMSFTPVPCTVSGNIKFYFPESGSNKWSVALTFLNYQVPIKMVEIIGDGPGVRSPNNYIVLPRGWTNKFLWRGVEDYIGQKWDIYNGGDGFRIRITSIFNEIISPNIKYSIPSSNPSTSIFNLGSQFQSILYNSQKDCKWPGPNAQIYKDKVISRIYNYQTKAYDDCVIGVWGCRTYFEGDFLVEWWLVHQSQINSLNLQYKGTECDSEICIELNSVKNGAVLIFGHSSNFDINDYSQVSFAAKIGENSTLINCTVSLTFDGCAKSIQFTIMKSWKIFKSPLTSFGCPSYIKNLKFIFGNTDILYLDDIQLEGPNEALINPLLEIN